MSLHISVTRLDRNKIKDFEAKKKEWAKPRQESFSLAVVVAQLAERWLPTPKIQSSNPHLGEEKEAGNGPSLKRVLFLNFLIDLMVNDIFYHHKRVGGTWASKTKLGHFSFS